MAIAALDVAEINPWSRITMSEYSSLHGVRDYLRRYLRGLRGLPKGMPNRANKANGKAARYIISILHTP